VSLLGLVVSVVGFILTVAQVRQAKTAAEAAAHAARKARAAILKSDLLVNCSTVLSVFEELKRLHRGSAWPIALDRYSALHQILMGLKADPGVLTEEQRTLLAGVTEQVVAMERKIEKCLATGKPPSSVRLNQIVVDQMQHVFAIQTSVKSQLVSEND
jgi:hypothetical protein